jgi:ribonuclease P/MRP protein subunit POP3
MVNLADGVSEYRQGRSMESRKRKRKRATKDASQLNVNVSKRAKKVIHSGVSSEVMDVEDADGFAAIPGGAVSSELSTDDAVAMEVEASAPDCQVSREPPSILQHLTIGINEVTRKLESQIRLSRQTVIISDKGTLSSESPSQRHIKAVFVCRADINPPILIDHLPHLVSACNSSRKRPDFIKLVPLPKGAELTLASAMGLRRVAVVAVDVTHLTNRTILTC